MSVESPSVSVEVREKPVAYATIDINVDRSVTYVGQPVTVYGTVKVNDVPAKDVRVELLVNGSKYGETTTDNNGRYSFKWTPSRAGKYVLKTRAYIPTPTIRIPRQPIRIPAVRVPVPARIIPLGDEYTPIESPELTVNVGGGEYLKYLIPLGIVGLVSVYYIRKRH